MSKYPYTTLHDLRDIVNIYEDCPDYEITLWNYTDQNKMTLSYNNVILKTINGQEVCYFGAWKKKAFRILPDNQRIIRTVRDLKAVTDMLSTRVADDTAIRVLNMNNTQEMRIYFTGSSKVTKEVHYNADYINEKYHSFRREAHTKWFKFKYKVKKFLHIK